MSTTDEELDKLFRDAAAKAPTPEYKPEFFAEIEKQLPVKKAKRSLAWWWTANLFLVTFIGWTSVEIFRLIIPIGNESLVGKSEQKGKLNYTSTKVDNSAIDNSDNTIEKTEKSSIKQKNIDKGNQQVNTKEFTGSGFLKKEKSYKSTPQFPIGTSDNSQNEGLHISESGGNENIKPEDSEESRLKMINLETRDLTSTFAGSDILTGKLSSTPAKKLSYFAEINFAIEQAWVRTEENSNAINGNFGLNGGLILTQGKFRYSAGLGLNYTKFDDLKIKERSIIYGFGSNILQNTYAFNGLLSVTAPIRIEYIVGRHSIDLNLVSSVNILTMVHRYQHIDEEEIISRRGYSNVSLMNRFGFKPMIGYSYFAKENTQLGFRFGAQLLTPIQSDRFIGSQVQMPLEGQFFIRQTLPSRK